MGGNRKGMGADMRFHFVCRCPGRGLICFMLLLAVCVLSGDTAQWVPSSSSDGSYQSLKKYLRLVFAYSGTATMEGETKKIAREDIRVGDVFIKGGSPGHVVMVVDVCEREDGAKAFLLAQGYMPAQEFHVLKNPRHEQDPWYYEEEVEYPFETPEYTFDRGSLRRLVYNE